MAEPLVRIGLIADIQHADIDNARSDYGKVRYYRDAVQKARLAAEDWASHDCILGINLGDTIDRRAGSDASSALDRVLVALQPYDRIVHIVGNHDLSALAPSDLERLETLRIPPGLSISSGTSHYFSIRIATGWHLLILDTYEISVKRCPVEARRLRRILLDKTTKELGACNHLREHEELNGAMGPDQLQWLQGCLEAARKARERVVLFSHAPVRPEPTYYQDALCWNWQEVNTVLDAYADVVAVVISGHDHFGGEVSSPAGVHHTVLEAAMEGELGTPTHAILELYDNGLALKGSGSMHSWERRLDVK